MTTEIIDVLGCVVKADSNTLDLKRDLALISKMSESELKQYASLKARQILEKLANLNKKIDDAKELANGAQGHKSGWFGKTAAKVDATAYALVQTNEALDELAQVQQNTLLYVCLSTRFAAVMIEAIAELVANGFTNTNGNVQEIDENTKIFARTIMSTANEFIRKQMAVDVRIDDNKRRLDRKDDLDEKQSTDIANNKRLIDENTAADLERDKRINALEEEVRLLRRQVNNLMISRRIFDKVLVWIKEMRLKWIR